MHREFRRGVEKQDTCNNGQKGVYPPRYIQGIGPRACFAYSYTPDCLKNTGVYPPFDHYPHKNQGCTRFRSDLTGRVGWGQLTQPDPRYFGSPLTRPDPTRPVRFENLLTRTDPTRDPRFEHFPTQPNPIDTLDTCLSRVGSSQSARPFVSNGGFDPRIRPVGRQYNNVLILFLYPTAVAICGLAVVGKDGCGHAYVCTSIYIWRCFVIVFDDVVKGVLFSVGTRIARAESEEFLEYRIRIRMRG